ncbi:hypothetical protein [Brevibacterium casei]|uniref:hypothetical protein n=1 Tax=Brevibacterium casei TaxID=33889 RepID=UPI0028AC1FA4|nr:hypothetical protein [Brevibacterium casei]
MTAETVGVIVQTCAVVVAATGVIVALCMGIADRRAADDRARKDRSRADDRARKDRLASDARAQDDRLAADNRADFDRREARMLTDHHFRLDMLVRLARNVNDPGHTDAKISSQLAAERAAILHVLGPDGLALNWETYVGPTIDESRTIASDEDVDHLKRCQNEVAVKITDEIAAWRGKTNINRA